MPIHGYPGGVITANPTAPTVSSASGVWTTEQQLINQSAGRWPMAATQISRSLRFNSADSAYLNRTPASAGNRQIFTWSGWVKRSASGNVALFTARTDDSNRSSILFESENLRCFNFSGGSVTSNLVTSAVFRDFSAWYHVVISMNTTTQVGKIYVNGVEQTLGTNTVGLNSNFFFNNTNAHAIGRTEYSTPEGYFNGYMTEINFVDGLALDPSYFGFNNSDTGVWSPKQYTGAYGTNGFYLNFSDNSGTTSTTLGKDYSGNGNNWTPNNFSVTAGAGNDSMVDSPTSYGTDTGVGGEVRGNYATLNPLNKSTNIVLANGNLQATNSVGAIENLRSTMPTASTYSYWEVTASVVGSSLRMDLGGILLSYVQSVSNTAYLAGVTTGTFGANWDNGFKFFINASNVYSSGTANLVANDVIMFAHDSSTGKIWLGLNGTWYNSGNPAAGTGNVGTLNAEAVFPAVMVNGGGGTNGVYINFGQRPFAYTAPSGFKALCTQNLPTPTIGATSTTQANDYFNVLTYNGSATSQNITGVGFSPDLVWIKTRSNAESHQLVDQVRGATKALMSNETSAETTWTNGLSAFLSDGFTLPGGNNRYSDTGYTYVAWNWNAGGSTVTNTSGTISAQVRANTTSGFSIVTYTGTGANATVGHGLGAVPSMIIVKGRDTVENWGVYHVSIGNTKMLFLNLTIAAGTYNGWNNTTPTSTVFSLGDTSQVGALNQNTKTYVAYCFAPVAGYSAFGSYTGNGSADGPFVYTGFRPRYVLIKSSSNVEEWHVHDTARDTYNLAIADLYPNSSSAEVTNSNQLDILSNGFKCRSSNSGTNGSGYTFIYAAFAENPFKYSLAR